MSSAVDDDLHLGFLFDAFCDDTSLALVSTEQNRPHAKRYIATLFDADASGGHPWDGVAQLWWPRVLPRPDTPMGTEPTDTFQQKALPYVPWPTTEYVVMDGGERLAVEPLTLNDQ